MNPRQGLILVALAATLQSARPEETNAPRSVLITGEEVTVPLPDVNLPMKVYLPVNYTPTVRWPVVFFYPSAHGEPSTALIRRYTGGRDFVVVGMPYAESNARRRSPAEQADYMAAEAENYRRARAWLATQAAIDPRRLLVGGASRGGWMAASLGEALLDELAGFIILFAGRDRGAPLPHASLARGKWVYVGAGQNDPNLHAARQAAEVYRSLGCATSFEEYPATGHEPPDEAPRLSAWLEARGRWSQNLRADEAGTQIAALLKPRYDAAMALTDPTRRFTALREVADDPRLPLCAPSVGAGIRRKLDELAAEPPVKDEWAAERTYRALLLQEYAIASLRQMKSVLDGYTALHREYTFTQYGKRAAADAARVAEAYEKSLAATRAANPQLDAPPPDSRPSVPAFPVFGGGHAPRPVKEGNHVRFE